MLPGAERRTARLQDLIFHVDQCVFFERDTPIGLPLGIRFHRVTPFTIGQSLVLPEMN